MENMDVISNGQAHGMVAQKLLASGMNVNACRPYIAKDGRAYININGKAVLTTNATLRYDEWKHYDKAVLEAAQNRMIGVADLVSRGLTYTIPNGMASTVLQYENASNPGEAVISMDGLNRGANDRMTYDIAYLPLPIIHSDFQINARVLAASRQGGSPLDTAMAEMAARRVAEKVETILFQGASTYTFGGGTIYGYEDFTSRQTGSLTAAWDASAASGTTIIADVLAMKQKMINHKKFGPYMIYIPPSYEVLLDEDYGANYPKTIRQRIMEISGIAGIKVSDYKSENSVLMVDMNSDTVRLVQGMGVTPVEWQEQGGMVTLYKVMTIQVPQLRADQAGNCGIVMYSE